MTERLLPELILRTFAWLRERYWSGQKVVPMTRCKSWRAFFFNVPTAAFVLMAAGYLFVACSSATRPYGAVAVTASLSGVYMVLRVLYTSLPPLRPEDLQPRHLAKMEALGYEVKLDEQLRITGFNMALNHAFFGIRFEPNISCWVGVRNNSTTDGSTVPGFLACSTSRTPWEEARRLKLLDRRAEIWYAGFLSKGGLRADIAKE